MINIYKYDEESSRHCIPVLLTTENKGNRHLTKVYFLCWQCNAVSYLIIFHTSQPMSSNIIWPEERNLQPCNLLG
uniref:Uncharacterized protein n=1 Tax=Lepeophtheirus salmonis TaxID=72036 RepID=A0A0K2UX34_LEPSM